MIPLHYEISDARRWAAFSGDYNPVHFDESWVRAQGGEGLSVHGMRALLDVKRFISPAVAPSPWLKCTVRLRRPLRCNTTYSLMRDAGRRVAATVAELPAGQPCISCQIMPETVFPTSANASQSTLDSTAFMRLQQAFTPLLPDAQRWHFLDALLFRHLIQDDALLRQEAIAALLPQRINMETLFVRFPVVQTHQEVVFDRGLLANWSPHAPAESLIVETLPALVVGDLRQGAIVRIASRTRYQNHAISNAVTLKIGPTAAQ